MSYLNKNNLNKNNFLSVEDFLSISIGPSSSHTSGPMLAAYLFSKNISEKFELSDIKKLRVDLYGSLALTGVGHGTDMAIINGLSGNKPSVVMADIARKTYQNNKKDKKINFAGINDFYLDFDSDKNIIFNKKIFFDLHSNILKISAFIKNKEYFEYYASVGGGFIERLKLNESGKLSFDNNQIIRDKSCAKNKEIPYSFNSAKELFDHAKNNNLSIANIIKHNEKVCRPGFLVEDYLLKIWDVMLKSIEKGCKLVSSQSDALPGGLNVKRRAPGLFKKLNNKLNNSNNSDQILSWSSLYALAVNEQNASSVRIVTAPTNGAAGIIPAVLNYYLNFVFKNNYEDNKKIRDDKIIEFLLTASAIGMLFKQGASISAAEVGCQGEVGVACSMAAAGLCAVLGGNLNQIERSAEMAMEHHLGLTCDPVGGLVQVPCIERNAVGTVTAINLANLAILENNTDNIISLDQVIDAMLKTGKDMKDQYKETALGGLAKVLGVGKNLPEC